MSQHPPRPGQDGPHDRAHRTGLITGLVIGVIGGGLIGGIVGALAAERHDGTLLSRTAEPGSRPRVMGTTEQPADRIPAATTQQP